MLKIIGIFALVWFAFATGLAQLALIWTMVLGTTVFG